MGIPLSNNNEDVSINDLGKKTHSRCAAYQLTGVYWTFVHGVRMLFTRSFYIFEIFQISSSVEQFIKIRVASIHDAQVAGWTYTNQCTYYDREIYHTRIQFF